MSSILTLSVLLFVGEEPNPQSYRKSVAVYVVRLLFADVEQNPQIYRTFQAGLTNNSLLIRTPPASRFYETVCIQGYGKYKDEEEKMGRGQCSTMLSEKRLPSVPQDRLQNALPL